MGGDVDMYKWVTDMHSALPKITNESEKVRYVSDFIVIGTTRLGGLPNCDIVAVFESDLELHDLGPSV
jgi:hypothetical protein